MAKRAYVDIRRKKSRSSKTGKRLAAKKARAAGAKPRIGSVKWHRTK